MIEDYTDPAADGMPQVRMQFSRNRFEFEGNAIKTHPEEHFEPYREEIVKHINGESRPREINFEFKFRFIATGSKSQVREILHAAMTELNNKVGPDAVLSIAWHNPAENENVEEAGAQLKRIILKRAEEIGMSETVTFSLPAE